MPGRQVVVLRKRLTADRAIARIERNVSYGGNGENTFASRGNIRRPPILRARAMPVPIKTPAPHRTFSGGFQLYTFG